MGDSFDTVAGQVRDERLSDRQKRKIIRRYVAQNRAVALSLLLHGTSEETIRLRRQYVLRLAFVIVGIILMFAAVFAAVVLIGDVEIPEFNEYQMSVFAGMVVAETLLAVVVLLSAFSCRGLIDRNVLHVMESVAVAPEQPSKATDWEEVIRQCRDTGLSFLFEIAEVLYNDAGDVRAVILKRVDGTYEIVYERLLAYDEEELRYVKPELPGCWHTVGGWKTVVDSVERGRRIAQHEMDINIQM